MTKIFVLFRFCPPSFCAPARQSTYGGKLFFPIIFINLPILYMPRHVSCETIRIMVFIMYDFIGLFFTKTGHRI